VRPGALEVIREGDADADSGRFVDPEDIRAEFRR
jgi:predicted transcriptional regulator